MVFTINNKKIEIPSGWFESRVESGFIDWKTEMEMSKKFNLDYHTVEEIILTENIIPLRYKKNSGILTSNDQLALHKARVVVAGCGGLGGYIIELCARLGIGSLVLVDPDYFDESNLNRQLNATIRTLGKSKAKIAAERVHEINPAVNVLAEVKRLDTNSADILANCNAVADALDTVSDRLELAKLCKDNKIPLVHGAVAGWYGQVSTQLPDGNKIEDIYKESQSAQVAEIDLGNPSFSPPLVAAIEVSEICKIITGIGTLLTNKIVSIDLLSGYIITGN